MSGNVPKDPAWCSYCRCPEHYKAGSPCPDHKGKDGKPKMYEGPDVYEPSDWVLSVVGKQYKCPDGIALCDGYDPRNGFWMRFADGSQRNVSERAIDRTYHKVR